MATRVTTTTEPDGTLAVTKTVLTGDRADRMAEARWLTDAASDFVVRVRNVGGDPLTIRTEHHGQRTLRTAREDPPSMARLLVRVARGVAELHGRGFVHGKLTVDHVIVGSDGSVRVCSPSGIATDPVEDLHAFGGIVTDLLRRWDEDEVHVPQRPEWERIASRLTEADVNTSPHRIARWFAPLAVERSDSDDSASGATEAVGARWRGIGVAMLTGFLILVSVARWASPGDASSPLAVEDLVGPTVDVDGQRYRFDRAGAAAAGTPRGCAAQAAYLDVEDTVWIVRDIADGAVAEPLARVPGATRIEFELEPDSTCSLWAAGPAGRTEVTTVTAVTDRS